MPYNYDPPTTADSFTTIDVPSGTDPVASGPSTLTLVAGTGITIVGSASNTVTITATGSSGDATFPYTYFGGF